MQTLIDIVHEAKEGQGRYKFYREHKYVSFVLNDLERLVAKTDFRSSIEVERVEQSFNSLVEMLRDHAQYEDSKLHTLLQKKGSTKCQEAQEDHQQHDALFAVLHNLLVKIKATPDEQLQIGLGYQFYLNYRKFVGENLLHLHEEETQILPELQRLYSDAELRTVEAETYQLMTIEELIQMMQVLFPHFNPSDRQAFLSDIQNIAPEKFSQIWEVIKEIIDPKEQKLLLEKLHIR